MIGASQVASKTCTYIYLGELNICDSLLLYILTLNIAILLNCTEYGIDVIELTSPRIL